jgi:hypothetical protein
MSDRLRLRQVCLVARNLEREARRVADVLGLVECHRDPNVAVYGLENVLFPVGCDFLEIVSPTRPGTAAGRFLDRRGDRYGYMVIVDCEDPLAWREHAAALGIRTANEIRHEHYLGVQLHPRDTGAAIVEFNRTNGGDDVRGPYAPAGPQWQGAVRDDVTCALIEAEIDCPDPASFAARWSALLRRPAAALADGGRRISLDRGAIRFLAAEVSEPVLAGVALEVVDPARVLDRARASSCATATGTFELCGIRVRPVRRRDSA